MDTLEKEVVDIENKSTEKISEEQEVVRPYVLRKLKDKDLFLLLKILRKIEIKDFKEIFAQMVSGEKTVKQLGMQAFFDMADILIENIPKAEEEIYSLWSDISGIPPEEIKEMEFGTLPMMIFDTFKEAGNASFFKVLSKLL